MTETPIFNPAAVQAQIEESLLLGLLDHVRAGKGLISARTNGDLQRMTTSLGISDLYAQVMLEAAERFEIKTGAGVAPRDALLQIKSDKGFMDRLISHSMQHMEVAHGA